MFKLVVLSALLAIATCHVIPAAEILSKAVHYKSEPIITGHTEAILKPHLEIPIVKTAIIAEPTHIEVHEPTIERVGEYVESVPTAVSHQSSTIVHSRAKIVTPIVAPAIKTHLAPIVKTYTTPVLAAPHPAPAPIFKTYEEAPILKTIEHETPILKTIEHEEPILKTYAAAHTAPIHYAAPIAPLHYAAPVLTKSVHYAAEPVVTGYSESILKPKLHTTLYSSVPDLTFAAHPEVHHYAAAAQLPTLSKEIHYSSEPVISGYSAEILKPKLETGHYDGESVQYPYSAQAW